MPFQTQVNYYQAAGVPGDIASGNVIFSTLAGEGGLVAGTGGLTIAAFGWIQADGRSVLNKPASGTAAPDGFVFRDMQSLITQWLEEYTMVIPEGLITTLAAGGDFFAVTKTTATRGQKVFASTTDGTISTGAAGATITGSVETKWMVASGGAAGSVIVISSSNKVS